jgi:hypothetical protein
MRSSVLIAVLAAALVLGIGIFGTGQMTGKVIVQ